MLRPSYLIKVQGGKGLKRFFSMNIRLSLIAALLLAFCLSPLVTSAEPLAATEVKAESAEAPEIKVEKIEAESPGVESSKAEEPSLGEPSLGEPSLGELPITIVSNTLLADKEANTVTFTGDVVVEEDFLLCSDEIVVNYDDNNQISEITAKGNVRIIRDNKVALGAEARYDRKERVAVITGNARVEQCSDTVSGDKIKFYLDRDDVSVEAGSSGRVKAVIMPNRDCKERVVSEELQCRSPR
jgi:lipopolysaccharide transport protein LptA